MEIKQGIVYGLSCTCHPELGWRYIGMTAQAAARRLRAHRGNAMSGMTLPLYRWMRKHGVENIVMTPLSLHVDRPSMGVAEARAIQRYKTHVSVGGLNVTLGGDGGTGFKHSAETRAAMSLAHIGKRRSPAAVAKTAAANTGSHRTEEQKRRIAKSTTGRKLSEAHKEKLAKKLTLLQVAQIKEWSGTETQAEIGALFSVSRITVNRIRMGRSRNR